MFKNLKNQLVLLLSDLLCIALGITAMYSVVNGNYIITACSVVILAYFAYLERNWKFHLRINK